MQKQLEAAVNTINSRLNFHVDEFLNVSLDRCDLTVRLQDGPIGGVGVNGIQITDLLSLVCEVYKELNKAFPCRENSLTITKIEEAIHWQDHRTKDREQRSVEGRNET